ncbi:MAG: hypothetical protein Q3968_06860 [Clostridiaceae bacterium]|nr:hypothetical protein [Clostridiaceae bacterium]
MTEFVSYEKLSKKEKRRVNARRRKTWQGASPVTRRTGNKKKYNRKKIKARLKDDDLS